MSETFKLIHSGLALTASLIFFLVGISKAYGIWRVQLPEELRILKRIEAIAFIVLSEALSIHVYVKWL